MSLHLYNTLTRTLEPFKPLKQDEMKVYYCGPTPYNFAHIGNLRSYLFEDFVIRTLRFLGYKARTVMNITDIDDKTIRDSQKSGKSLQEFTEYYTSEFLSDLTKLGIQKADTIAPISGLIPEMEKLIQGLLDKGYAYLAEDGSIYYRVEKFKKYGELAHLDMSGMKSSVRINNDEYDKDNVADFALWKAYDEAADGPNQWKITLNLPIGTIIPANAGIQNLDPETSSGGQRIQLSGRPGWHIECSACNYRFFGEQIDIHMGGIDNLFPHHQNEVAQTEAFTGKQFSKYWMHGGHLLVDNKKMAKSAGNFYTLRDIVDSVIAKNEAIQETGNGLLRTSQGQEQQETLIYRGFRLMALQNQYRENFNFTFERLAAAINTIKGLDEMMKRLGRYKSALPEGDDLRNAHGKMKFHNISREFRENQQYFMQEFIEKLENDFDTVSAMTIVFEFQSYINSGIDDELFSLEETKSLISLLESWNEVLAILDFSLLESNIAIPKEIEALAVARTEAKMAKNWAEADNLRDELTSLGWKMIDEAGGKWRVEKI
ncbi:MAG: cysteine--tRNA ligase [Candidatus Gracilibacteria bacterium]|nr:cysteine--tRNA ligase [Candidatus Gracilibacteria bacterium]